MPPIPASFAGPAVNLTLTPMTACTVQLPANTTGTDASYMVLAFATVERAAGSAYVQWYITFEETPLPAGVSMAAIETGAVKGITMSVPIASGPPTQETQQYWQVIRSPKGAAAINVLMRLTSNGSGIKVLGESDSSGEKVTTMLAYRAT